MMEKIIFIDRDGVINQDSEKYIKNVDELTFIEGSIEAIVNLSQAGFKVVVCTNQSGLGRGLLTVEDLNEIHERIHQAVNQAGGSIAAIIFCPHTPDDNCECRKPKSGMIINICERFNIEDLTKVTFIGDSIRDLLAINNVSGIPILVLTGNGKKTLEHESLPKSTLVFDDLLLASEYLIDKLLVMQEITNAE